MPLDVTFNSRDAENRLTGLVRFLGNTASPNVNRKPLDEWGEYMQARTDLLFETGSRDGVRWDRLRESTKASRRLRGIKHAKVLQVTGGLRKSVRAITVQSLDGLTARIYSQHPRAKIHHRGANVPARTISARNAKALRFSVGGRVVFAKRVNVPAFEIPARPILFISDRDHATGLRYIREHRLKLTREAVRRGIRPAGAVVGIPRGAVLA